MKAGTTVWVVEDDPRMRDSLVRLLQSAGHGVKAYATPTEFLESYKPDLPGCLVFDLQLPEMNGLELSEAVRERGGCHPFIVISGHCDVSQAVESMHQGAVDFIEKPFNHRRLLQRVHVALQRDEEDRHRRRENDKFCELIESLTRREREVMKMVAEGLLTKQIARRLEISEKTVEVHRSHITKKMHVRSVAQLVRLLTQHSETLTESG